MRGIFERRFIFNIFPERFSPFVFRVTLPLKNVSLAEWFNSDKENANDENIKGALHARIQARGGQAGLGHLITHKPPFR